MENCLMDQVTPVESSLAMTCILEKTSPCWFQDHLPLQNRNTTRLLVWIEPTDGRQQQMKQIHQRRHEYLVFQKKCIVDSQLLLQLGFQVVKMTTEVKKGKKERKKKKCHQSNKVTKNWPVSVVDMNKRKKTHVWQCSCWRSSPYVKLMT